MQKLMKELAGVLPAKKPHPSGAAAIQAFAGAQWGAQWIEGGNPYYSQERLGRNSRVFRPFDASHHAP